MPFFPKPFPQPFFTSRDAGARELNDNDPDADAVEEFIRRRKKATINDVAYLARVSKKTVSRVINNSPSVRPDTRDQVNGIIARIGFRPDPQARGLAFRRSFLIGLIYDNPNAQYIVNMQTGALNGLRGSGMELVVHPSDRLAENFIEEIREFIELQRLAGVILLPPVADDMRLVRLMEELDVPFVRVTARPGAASVPPIRTGAEIVSHDREGCGAAGEHIAKLGHTRVGFIQGNPAYPSAHERRAGFFEGLRRHGLFVPPDMDLPGDYSFDAGYTAGKTMLSRPDRPTAIICCNDEMAAGVYHAAHELGLHIPKDLTVIGFDDAPIASKIVPPMTTVGLPTRNMARTAAETLISPDFDGKASIVFQSSLLIRGSAGPAPKL